jgi:hypothetical protein
VHPGGVKTRIATNALESARALGLEITEAEEKRRRVYEEKLLKLPAQAAAEIILKGVERDRPRVLVGTDAKAVDVLVRALPGRYVPLWGKLAKRLG